MSIDNKNAMINEQQRVFYRDVERMLTERYVEVYFQYLDKLTDGLTDVKAVDIGGAQGFFALALKEYFDSKGIAASVSVIDYCRYGEWENQSSVSFIEESAFTALEKLPDNSIDAVFINLVLHHLVAGSYRKSRHLQKSLFDLVYKKLKTNGCAFVCETTTRVPLLGALNIPLAYYLTSSGIPAVQRLMRHFDSKSAGVGVLFLSPGKWAAAAKKAGFSLTGFHDEPWFWLRRPVLRQKFYCFVFEKR